MKTHIALLAAVALLAGCATPRGKTAGDITLTVITKYSDGTPVKQFQAGVSNVTPWIQTTNGVAKVSVAPSSTPEIITVQNLANTMTGAFYATQKVNSLSTDTEFDLTLNKCKQGNGAHTFNGSAAALKKTLKCITLTIRAKDSSGNPVMNFQACLNPSETGWYQTTNGVVKMHMNQYENPVTVSALSLTGSTANFTANQPEQHLMHNQWFNLVLAPPSAR